MCNHMARFVRCLTKVHERIMVQLRLTPLHLATISLDSVIRKAEDEISQYDNRGYTGRSHIKQGHCHLYVHPTKSAPDTGHTS